jgi:hypothetical protein
MTNTEGEAEVEITREESKNNKEHIILMKKEKILQINKE